MVEIRIVIALNARGPHRQDALLAIVRQLGHEATVGVHVPDVLPGVTG